MEPRHAPVTWQFWTARARIVYQPLGVAGVLPAWNYPLFLSLGPKVDTLAAGNHVMLKASDLAPKTAELMRTTIAELFAPNTSPAIPAFRPNLPACP